MKQIAQLFVKHDIVKTNFTQPFTWTSGIKSPIYCDCRELTGIVEARNMVLDAFIEMIKSRNINPDAVAGTATAGISWAALVADRLNLPMGYVRSKPKGHGAGKMVEGRLPLGANVMVVEDAFSTGGSSIKSAEALRTELEATVTDVFGIFSWDTPTFFENKDAAGLTMTAFTNFTEIVEALLEAGRISAEEKASLERFHHNPSEWWTD